MDLSINGERIPNISTTNWTCAHLGQTLSTCLRMSTWSNTHNFTIARKGLPAYIAVLFTIGVRLFSLTGFDKCLMISMVNLYHLLSSVEKYLMFFISNP